MTLDAYAPMVDAKTAALARLITTLAEDAIFALGTGGSATVLEGIGRRRGEAYQRAGVVTIDEASATAIRAVAIGSEDYDVRIEIDGSTLVLACSCPAFDDFGPCKHLWATALVADERRMLREYVRLYCERWREDRGIGALLERVPGLFTWDDHDIFDGWGSWPEDRQDCPVFRGLIEVAREHFALFQLGAVPGSLPEPFPDQRAFSLRLVLWAITPFAAAR